MVAYPLIYPASCPRCSSQIAGVLLSDPDVPWYACGTVAQSTRAADWKYRCAHLLPAHVDNLELPTADELDGLRSVIDALTWATEWPGDAVVDFESDARAER